MEPLSPPERRVLGTLIEKSMATPDYYPMTMNALRAGCNQATSREPVSDYAEPELDIAIQALRRKGLAAFHDPRSGGSVRRIGHTLFEKHRWGLERGEVALLAVLLLRGDQTASELKARCERMSAFDSLGDVEEGLRRMAGLEEPVCQLLPKAPGQREARWRHLLSIDAPAITATASPAPAITGAPIALRESEGGAEDRSDTPAAESAALAPLIARIDRLEEEIRELRAALGLPER